MQWQTKYSSAEMAFLEIKDRMLLYYIDYPRNMEGRWTLEEVLAGDADYSLNCVFLQAVIEEVKLEVRRLMNQDAR
jgi:hypothetical protein